MRGSAPRVVGEGEGKAICASFGGLSGFAVSSPRLPAKIPREYVLFSESSEQLQAVAKALEGLCEAKPLRKATERPESLSGLLKSWAASKSIKAASDIVGDFSCLITDKNSEYDSDGSFAGWDMALVLGNGDIEAFEGGAIIERLEASCHGLGQRIVSAIDDTPYDVYTMGDAADAAGSWFWDNYSSEAEGRKEEGEDRYVSRNDFRNQAPEWAWDCSKREKHSRAIAPEEKLEAALRGLEDANKAFNGLIDKDVTWVNGSGHIPSAALHWKGLNDKSGTSLVQRFGDEMIEDVGQCYVPTHGLSVFPFNFSGGTRTVVKAFALAEAYIKCGAAAMELLRLLDSLNKQAVPKPKTLVEIFGSHAAGAKERVVVHA